MHFLSPNSSKKILILFPCNAITPSIISVSRNILIQDTWVNNMSPAYTLPIIPEIVPIMISVQEVVFKPREVDENPDFILILLSLINSSYIFTTNKTDTSEWPYPFIACGQ